MYTLWSKCDHRKRLSNHIGAIIRKCVLSVWRSSWIFVLNVVCGCVDGIERGGQLLNFDNLITPIIIISCYMFLCAQYHTFSIFGINSNEHWWYSNVPSLKYIQQWCMKRFLHYSGVTFKCNFRNFEIPFQLICHHYRQVEKHVSSYLCTIRGLTANVL